MFFLFAEAVEWVTVQIKLIEIVPLQNRYDFQTAKMGPHKRQLLFLTLSAVRVIASSQEANEPQPRTKSASPARYAAPAAVDTSNPLLGLPAVPVPADDPKTPAKITIASILFHDKGFSIDGTISCSSCHDNNKALMNNG